MERDDSTASIFANTAVRSSSATTLALRDASVPRATVTFVLLATARPGAVPPQATKLTELKKIG